MSSIFTKIVRGEILSYKVAEDGEFLSFLDAMPLVEGHTLVIPKEEIDFIFDLDTEKHQRLWAFAQQVAKKLEKTYPGKRIAVAVVGIEVPHAHIHLVPISEMDDLNFSNKRLKFTPEEYTAIAEKIKNN
ncbi:HIT family protein [Bergeyella cardium]|uniref:HIT family protein n=1 Tax=Bergeyella cardium TaxID=1585976 RepID=UPI000EA09FFB|nr:HIT family protein [Bergeyella cardium]